MSDLNGELLAAMVAASDDRKRAALQVLKGEAVVANGDRAKLVEGPLLMGIGAGAEFLGVSRATLWRAFQAGRLEKVELYPGSYRVRREDLVALASGRTSGKTTKVRVKHKRKGR